MEVAKQRREFTAVERSQAKALTLSLGGARKARKALESLWEVLPSENTLNNWLNDPRVVPDTAFVDALVLELRSRAIGQAGRAIDKIGVRLEKEAESGDALDVQRLAQAYATLYSLFVQKEAEPKVAVNVHGLGGNGNVVIMPFRPRPEKIEPVEEVVETTAS